MSLHVILVDNKQEVRVVSENVIITIAYLNGVGLFFIRG
jgi:hypothetical protein